MCCPLEMNYTTSSDALPWSSPRIVLPRRRSTHTDRQMARTMSTANQGQLLFSSAALGRCACVSTSYTLCARTRAYVHVWVGTCKYAWGQASTPRCSFNTEGTFPGDASEDRNLADECPSPCLLCCFTTPWLRTSAKQPQRPFVILMVTGGTLQLLTRTQSSDCAPRVAMLEKSLGGVNLWNHNI